ncbi:MAG: Uncharacterised protein [Cyanobium sp. ARS6]|nr:MAG: Uncharacterised protein [Cyanobium sp. ARS6]
MTQLQRLFPADHSQGREIRDCCWLLVFPGGRGFALIPEFFQQLGARIGRHQLEAWINPSQFLQQCHTVGVHMSHHNQQGLIRGWQSVQQSRQEHVAVGHPRGMNQNGGVLHSCCIWAGFEQETVGRAATLQRVFQFEAKPLGAEPPQADQALVDRQADHLPFSGCRAGRDAADHQ